jgi:transposase-like protein
VAPYIADSCAGKKGPASPAQMAIDRTSDRWRAVAACEACKENVASAARRIGRSEQFVRKWYNRYKATGSVSDKPRSGRPCALSSEAASKARVLATTRLKKSCASIANHLNRSGDCANVVSRWTVSRALQKGRKKWLMVE